MKTKLAGDTQLVRCVATASGLVRQAWLAAGWLLITRVKQGLIGQLLYSIDIKSLAANVMDTNKDMQIFIQNWVAYLRKSFAATIA